MNHAHDDSITTLSQSITTVNIDRDMVITTLTDPYHGEQFPVRFDGLVIALVLEGEAEVSIDSRNYSLRPGSLLVIHPRNYTDSAQGTDMKLAVVACSHHLVEKVLPALTDLTPLLLYHRVSPVTDLNEEDRTRILEFFRFMYNQMHSEPDSPFKRKKMLALLQGCLFEMMDIELRGANANSNVKNRSEEIFSRFLLLVSEYFQNRRTVAYYADRLCITPKHLSAVVKKLSGRTAGDWIENYVVSEAKVLLRTTDIPVQEIASRLGFPNQSFFGKYFKHHTDLSPTDYRRLSVV